MPNWAKVWAKWRKKITHKAKIEPTQSDKWIEKHGK